MIAVTIADVRLAPDPDARSFDVQLDRVGARRREFWRSTLASMFGAAAELWLGGLNDRRHECRRVAAARRSRAALLAAKRTIVAASAP